MTTNEALVSVCVPAYNVGVYIQETLQSVLKQSYKNLEIIVVNDGSTDDTLLQAKQIKDERLVIINVINKGASAARNLAFANSKGEYILFMDADDLIHKDFLNSQLRVLNRALGNVSVSAWGRFHNNNLNTLTMVEMPEKISSLAEWVKFYWHQANPMTNPGRILIPREIAELAGPWNEQLNLNDDLEYFTRVFAAAKGIVLNPEALFYYRSGVNGLSGLKSEKAYKSLVLSLALSVNEVLQHYPSDKRIQLSCANMWQSVLYELYPSHKSITRQVEAEVAKLNGSNLPFPAGRYTSMLAKLIGWKLAKRLKGILN